MSYANPHGVRASVPEHLVQAHCERVAGVYKKALKDPFYREEMKVHDKELEIFVTGGSGGYRRRLRK